MIKIDNYEVLGWEHAIRGMRNPMNSWKQSDSDYDFDWVDDSVFPHKYGHDDVTIGPNDWKLMMNLRNTGTDHRKFMRMITVYLDITAPLYWWKEFDTYKVGTVANSCSTMHKIHAKEFVLDDFSHEHLIDDNDYRMDYFESMLYDDQDVKEVLREGPYRNSPLDDLKYTIDKLNVCRRLYLDESIKGDRKVYWWQMIQLLPSSYNQKRTVMLNYEVLSNIYKSRRNHKLDEWHTLCDWIEELPYSELITGEQKDDVSI